MKARSALGWQTSLADLSLILFMLTSAALAAHNQEVAQQKGARHSRPQPAATKASARPSERSEPLAIYAPGPGAPPLGRWLAQQAPDPRQQLTITMPYGPTPGARDAALREGARLLGEAGAAAVRVRLVVEPGAGPAKVALAYDQPAGPDPASGPLGDDGTRLAGKGQTRPPRNP